MTKRDFFIIVIRLFGLYALILSVFSILPSNISWLTYPGRIDSPSIFLTILTLGIAFSLMVLLLFKADRVVTFLKLDKGFDEDRISLNELNSESILRLGLIIIGGFLILDNIAWLLEYTLYAFKTDLTGSQIENPYKINWLVCGMNLVIGILLITNLNYMVRILNKKIEKQQ